MRRYSLGAILVALVAIGALWFRHGLRVRGDVSRALLEAADGSTPAGSSTPNALHIAPDEAEISDRDDPAKIRRMIEAGNVPINFWGRVVDQDGVPLPGVRIDYTYSIHHGNDQGVAWIDQETRKGEIMSDGDGSFAITNLKGHDLTIESLTKPGYLYRGRWQLAYNFHGDTPGGKFEPRRDKPVRVIMIKLSGTEPLIHVKGGLRVSGDGTLGRWNLWSGEPDDDGELAVSLRREPAVVQRSSQLAAWSADLQVIGGEMVEAPWEEEVHRAPESGYSATVPYPKESQKEGVGPRSFYLRTANGNYGRIQVELYPHDDGPSARCFISSDMNPRSGSRNLEPIEEE